MNEFTSVIESTDALRQDEWDALRLGLFVEVMELDLHSNLMNIWQRFKVALTNAFDRPLPVYRVYRPLRTFAVARWPVLRQIISTSGNTRSDITDLINILEEVTKVLEQAVDERIRDQADRLEIEMELLRTLLATDRVRPEVRKE